MRGEKERGGEGERKGVEQMMKVIVSIRQLSLSLSPPLRVNGGM